MHDKEATLQATIDAPQLNKYFHSESLSNRIPLRIVKGQWYEDGIRLTKFRQPVVFISAESASGPFIEIMSLKVQSVTAEIEFRYAVEGIVGQTILKRTNDNWIVESMNIRER